MADQIVYSFEDADGDEETSWTTTDFHEARRYARDNECRLVENTYRWYDSVTVEDYCREEDQESDEDIQTRIDAGVVVLTEHFGDAATWANRIPIDGDEEFDIDSPSACVLHYVFHVDDGFGYSLGYGVGCDVLSLNSSGRRVCDLGFCANGDDGDRLTELWRETIARLQTPS